MNILFVNASLVWGGNEKWTLRAAETLADRGHDVYMAVRDPAMWNARVRAPVTRITLPFTNDADLWTIWKLRQLIKKHKIEILLPTRSRDYWLAGLANFGRPAKYVMRMGITRELEKTFKNYRRYGTFPDGIIVNAEAVKNSLARYPWVCKNIRVIYNGVDKDSDVPPNAPDLGGIKGGSLNLAEQGLRSSGSLPESSTFLVISAGRIEREKGFHVLVDALALAMKQEPNLRATIFGEGSEVPNLEKQIQDCGLQQKIKLGGFTKNLSAELASADLAVSPSFREGISNFILESWSAGVPLIATSIEGSAEIVHDNIRGKLVPPGNAEAMADAILLAMRNKAQRDVWIKNGYEAIEKVHNWETMARRMEEFFQNLKLET